MFHWLLGRARAQGMLEYALIIALVAVVVIASLMLLGPQVSTIFHKVANNL
jgi:pilus assembly protein Flp/PilA